MPDAALDEFIQLANARFSRGRIMRGISGGALAAIIAGVDDLLAGDKNKKKKRKRKRRRRKNRNSKLSSPPTCAEQCPEGVDVCLDRAADSTLWGNNVSTQCTPCSSDQDCVGSAFAYCLGVNGVTLRATEEPSPQLTDQCGLFVDAVCASVAV